MEHKYYRELKHNYLVYEDKSAPGESRYRYKIAESGRIKGLVPLTERSINGEKYFYYEINSMQSLRDRFSSSGMNAEQLKSLLSDIKSVLEELSEFLLGDEGIVFNSVSIYTDLSSGAFKFIYCPFFDEQKSFSEFAMELLELVDEKDAEATELVYKLCEQSASLGDFVYEALENTLAEEIKEKADNSSGKETLEKFDVSFEESPDEGYEDSYDDVDDEKKQGGIRESNKRLGGKLQLFLAFMFICVVGAMVYIRMNYILSSEENMLSIFVMLVSAATGVVAMIGGFKELKGSGKVPGKEKTTAKLQEDELYQDDELCESDGDVFGYDDDYDFVKQGRAESSFAKKSFDCGETVVLDEVKSDGIALFSRNLDKTVRIALDQLPLTVGKMEGCVDKVLGDMSISRMHCRFINDGGRIAIIDLGSTNGSYRNGLRPAPQEKTYIEEGDEIRLGRVCFDCR